MYGMSRRRGRRWENSSSSPDRVPVTSSLFLVFFLLFYSLSFFVVDGVGDEESVGVVDEPSLERTKTTMTTWTGDSQRTIEDSTFISIDNGNQGDTNVTSDGESESASSRANEKKTSFRNQNFTSINLSWQWNWDPEWEKETSAGLAMMGVVSDGRLTSTFLSHGMLGRFVFLNYKEGDNWISFTVTPCTSVLYWSIRYMPANDKDLSFLLRNSRTIKTFRTDRTVTFNHTDGQRGFYTLEIRPLIADTYVHFHVSTTPFDNPVFPTLDNSTDDSGFSYTFLPTPPLPQRQGRIFVKKLRGERVSIKWEASSLSRPQSTQYCIVVNTRKDYSSLCGAQGERYGVVPPDLTHLPYYYKTFRNNQRISSSLSNNTNYHWRNELEPDRKQDAKMRDKKTSEDIIIGCLGRRRNYILNNIREGQLYHINVFIKNTKTNLSYPYLRTTYRFKPSQDRGKNLMRDSKPFTIDLPGASRNGVQPGGPTILKFNLKKACAELTMYAMPCGGGSITYEVFNGNQCIHKSEEVSALDIIKITKPCPGNYTIKVFQVFGTMSNKLDSTVVRKAEFLVSKRNKRFPLPKLPVNRKITEDMTQRTCDSVTIEWWPSPGGRDSEYCIYLKKETRARSFNFKEPIQCNLEQNLKRDRFITHTFCLQRTSTGDDKRLRQRLIGLQPGRIYVVQLIVRRQNGMSLSYDLHHVATFDDCLENHID